MHLRTRSTTSFVATFNLITKHAKIREGALVWWLWEETRVQKVVSSNPGTLYWIDIFSHLFVVQNCIVCLKGRK